MSSIKILEKGDLEMFQVDEHVGMLGECQTQKEHGSSVLPNPDPYLALCITSILLFLSCTHYNKPVIISKVLS